MEKNKSIRISQCMIVKNEENNIAGALSWGKDIMWEQIVVDTGSTDRTVEIALKMGASIYQFPWIDDFAAAKNFAISKAKGDWIVFLDADEALSSGDDRKLLSILNQIHGTDADGVTAAWLQIDDEGKIMEGGTQIRIFRNRKGIGYRRRIHEQLELLDGTPMKIADGSVELSILHSGYSRGAKKKKETDRNLKLILKELEDHPDDYEMLGYLGDEYYISGDIVRAESTYRRSISHMPEALDERDQRSAATFLYLMQIMKDNNSDLKEIVAIYRVASNLLSKEADFDYLLGMVLVDRGDCVGAATYLEQALSKLEKYGSYNRAMRLMGHLQETYETLAWCFLVSGENEQAVRTSIAVLKSAPYSMQALVTLMKGFHGSEPLHAPSAETVVDFLGKLYDLNALRDKIFLFKASKSAEWAGLAAQIERLFSAEELSHIRSVWREE